MKITSIPVNTPQIAKSDSKAVARAMKQTYISGESPIVVEFEEKFSKYCNMEHGVSVSSGTLALDIVIDSLGLKIGDEVIIQSFTIISCLSQILRAGATPIFIDSNESNWNINVDDIESHITSRTKAILIAHIYGLPADMDPIINLGLKHGIVVIEDASQAHGLLYKKRICGSLGDVSTFSFYANKNITTGEGGMILTHTKSMADSARNLRSLNFSEERRFKSFELGWGGRLSSMQAALGLSQLSRIDEIRARKVQIGIRYRDAFKDSEHFEIAPSETAYAVNNYWIFGLVLRSEINFTRQLLQSELLELGIQTRPFFYPLHLQPVLEKFNLLRNQPSLPIAEKLGERGFYLPGGAGIKDSQIDKVIDAVLNLIGKN